MNTLIKRISEDKIKDFLLTREVLDADTTLTAIDDLDNRLKDMTLDMSETGIINIMQTLKTIIKLFGGNATNGSFVNLTITDEDISLNNNVVTFLQRPMLEPGTEYFTIDWND